MVDIPKQNGGDYDEPWHTYGCRALTLAAIAQIDAERVIPPRKLQQALDDLSVDGSIVNGETAETGLNEHEIIRRAFELTGSTKTGRQVGVRNADGSGWQADAEHDYQIVQFPTSGSVGTHFVLCDNDSRGIYDPWQGDDLISGKAERWLLYRVWEA